MASVVSHFLVGATLALPISAATPVKKAVRPAGLIVACGLLAAVPDLDTVFFGTIPYAHFFGHRGFFHSPVFAISVALALSCLLFAVARNIDFRATAGVAVASSLAMVSHGFLDAMTDAGLGVMLLYPFSEQRLFFSWRPFHAPPIKISGLSLAQVGLIIRSEWPLVTGCALVSATVWLLSMARPNLRSGRR